MSIPASELQSHATGGAVDGGPGEDLAKVAGKSPTQLAMARFRKDKLSMVAFVVVAAYSLLAIAAPFLVHWGVLDPYSFHNSSKYLNINLGSVRPRRLAREVEALELAEPCAREFARVGLGV